MGSDWTYSRFRSRERKIREQHKVARSSIAEIELPAASRTKPMSYTEVGKQFVLIACGRQEEDSMLLVMSLP